MNERRPAALLVAILLLVGCEKISDPIPACQQYEVTLATCFHRPSAFASQEALQPKTSADREHIRELCATNLERIRRACR
jgi:hypothetical protein